MSKLIRAIAVIAASSSLVACATAASDVQPTFQAASVYNDLSCEQIALKLNEVSKRVTEVSGKQDAKRKTDQAATGVGVIVFWPALFLLATPGHKAELSQLKGTYEALNRAAEGKQCKI